MKWFGYDWTPETADGWTRHDAGAGVVSALTFVLFGLGSAWAAVGDARGWWLLAASLGAGLLLWALVDRKLKAQSLAFERREGEHKRAVEERNRWGG